MTENQIESEQVEVKEEGEAVEKQKKATKAKVSSSQATTAITKEDVIAAVKSMTVLELAELVKALENEFADEFVRIHRNALVAVARIESLKKSPDGQVSVTMRDGVAAEEGLAISRRHLATVRRRIKKG